MCLRGEKLPSAARTWASLGAFESFSLSHSGAGFHQGFCPSTDSSCRAETLSGKALKKARSFCASLVPPHELPLSGTSYGPTLLFLVESAVLKERGDWRKLSVPSVPPRHSFSVVFPGTGW